MMESTALFPENDDPPKPSNKTTLLSSLIESSDDGKLFGGGEAEEDADLFGSLSLDNDSPTEVARNAVVTSNNVVDKDTTGDLMSQLLVGESTTTAEPVSPTVAAVTSKLSGSGLLESATIDGGGVGGGSSGGGLFDEIDSHQEAEEERRRRQQQLKQQAEAEEAAKKQQRQEAESDTENGVMHELNLHEFNGHNYGMGMGLGGQIQREAVLPPQQQQPQYGNYSQQPQGVMNAMAGSYYYSTTGAGQMQGLPQQQQQQQPRSLQQQQNIQTQPVVNRPVVQPHANYQSTPHYAKQQQHSFPQAPKTITDYTPPPPFDSPYGKITVTDPMLIQGTGLFAGPPHWTYLLTLYSKSPTPQPMSAVRRRFRHFVALEDRLRQSVPGAILPPRPEKHPARAIEEASTRQSSEFAQQRSNELTLYMNALAKHPHVGNSPELKLFMTLQDHIGTAWPEVSSSAFTRITAVGTASVEKLADTVDGMLSELGTAQQVAAGEDNAEILALAAYEGRRIGAVSGSVPKIEGTVSILKERGDRLGGTGLEMSKLAKDVAWCDRELSGPMEVLSSGLLRSGRRTKRLGLEVGAGIAPFVTQYKLCRYEQMAFVDRRTALKRRSDARSNADKRAAKVMMNQTSMSSIGRLGTLERMEMEAALADEMATEAAREAEEVASRLQSEVGRIGAIRVSEWDGAMKVVASAMKEGCAENAAIWEAALEVFKRDFPEVHIPNGVEGTVNDAVSGN
eukprot:CCRYP_001106-RA/>CCRYP_001106-RA protein AED:0.28 eAED:0.28 QI:0/-1/0/1/-1/1/1/0/735